MTKIIDDAGKTKLKEALKRARANPITEEMVRRLAVPHPGAKVLTVEDREANFQRPAREHVRLLSGYRASMAVEEQPTGLCLHLSVSNDETGDLPGGGILVGVAAACCNDWPVESVGGAWPLSAWTEEFMVGGVVKGLAIHGLFRLRRPN